MLQLVALIWIVMGIASALATLLMILSVSQRGISDEDVGIIVLSGFLWPLFVVAVVVCFIIAIIQTVKERLQDRRG
jgi:uncharacterized membrane protein